MHSRINKSLLTAIILIIFLSCEEKPNGVWLSYNNREYIHDTINAITSGREGFFIDFDRNRFGILGADSTAQVEIDFEKGVLKVIHHEDLIIPFSTLNKDSVEIDMGENVMHVFRKLDLSYKIERTKEEITEYLEEMCMDSIQGYKLKFTSEQFFREKSFKLPHIRNNLWNENWKDTGFWFVDKYNDQAFLIFTIGQVERKNIFQIISISEGGIELKHLQEDGSLTNVRKIGTCL